jgi:hypothetical protein
MPECILWQRTTDLAKDYGHDMSQSCPLTGVCEGTKCAFLDPITALAAKDAVNTERKLSALRQELSKHR